MGQGQHILNVTAHVSYKLLLVSTMFKFIIATCILFSYPIIVMDSEQVVLEQFLHYLCEHLGEGFRFEESLRRGWVGRNRLGGIVVGELCGDKDGEVDDA